MLGYFLLHWDTFGLGECECSHLPKFRMISYQGLEQHKEVRTGTKLDTLIEVQAIGPARSDSQKQKRGMQCTKYPLG